MMASVPHPQARRRTAFHEAGHAVVAWALDRPVTGLRLLSDQDGEADVGDVGSLPLVKQIAVAMGGWYGAERSGVEQLHDSDLEGDHAFSGSRNPHSPTIGMVLLATPSTVQAVI